MDADQLGALHHLAPCVQMMKIAQAMDAIAKLVPVGIILGCAHTQANFKEAFWKSICWTTAVPRHRRTTKARADTQAWPARRGLKSC